MQKLFISLMGVLLVIAVLVFVPRATPQSSRPATPQGGTTINWSPSKVASAVGTGTSTSVQVSFTSNTSLQNAIVEPAPELIPFVTIQPSSFASITAGQVQVVQMNISVPIGTTLGAYDGTIHLRIGNRTLSQTLKTAILATPLNIIVPIPDTYSANAQVAALGGPVLLNNFNSQYEHGGFVPPGGSEISIATMPLPPSLGDLIANEMIGATINSTVSITVSGSSCTEVFYTDTFGPSVNYSEVTAYCPHNTTLYKLFLFYRFGDPNGSQFLSTFQQVLNSIQFTL